MVERDESPWRRARSDWRGVRSLRTLVDAVVGGLLGVVAVALIGTGDPVADTAIVAGAVVLAAILLPVGELMWLRIRAPGLMLREDVHSLREDVSVILSRLDAAPPRSTKEPEPPINVRLSALNHLRIGREVYDVAKDAPWGPQRAHAATWAQNVTHFLAQHVSAKAAEGFLRASNETGVPAMVDQLAYLEKAIEEEFA